jgi:hypothetical protein
MSEFCPNTLSENRRCVAFMFSVEAVPAGVCGDGGFDGLCAAEEVEDVGEMDSAANPEGWVLRWLCLDSHNRVVRRIHPDSATIEKLLIALGVNLEYEKLPPVFVGFSN